MLRGARCVAVEGVRDRSAAGRRQDCESRWIPNRKSSETRNLLSSLATTLQSSDRCNSLISSSRRCISFATTSIQSSGRIERARWWLHSASGMTSAFHSWSEGTGCRLFWTGRLSYRTRHPLRIGLDVSCTLGRLEIRVANWQSVAIDAEGAPGSDARGNDSWNQRHADLSCARTIGMNLVSRAFRSDPKMAPDTTSNRPR